MELERGVFIVFAIAIIITLIGFGMAFNYSYLASKLMNGINTIVGQLDEDLQQKATIRSIAKTRIFILFIAIILIIVGSALLVGINYSLVMQWIFIILGTAMILFSRRLGIYNAAISLYYYDVEKSALVMQLMFVLGGLLVIFLGLTFW